MAKIRVRYKGIADERIISQADLESLDIKNVGRDLVWNRANLFAVDVPTSERLEELLQREGHFSFEEVKDDGSTALLSDADNPNHEGNVLIDGDTGASTEVKDSAVPSAAAGTAPTEATSEAVPASSKAKGK